MWEFASANHSLGFRDYTTSDTAQSVINWMIIRGIRATGDPVGVTMKKGKHEVLAVGFKTYNDPKYYGSGIPGTKVDSELLACPIGPTAALSETRTLTLRIGTRCTSSPTRRRVRTTTTSMSPFSAPLEQEIREITPRRATATGGLRR